MNATRRDEILATYAERGPLTGERLIEYGVFLTDAFGLGSLGRALLSLDSSGIPANIDGFENDDSYRRSRNLALRKFTANPYINNQLRESSLARQIENKSDQPATIRLIRRSRPEDAVGRDATQGGRQFPWVHIIPPNTKFFLESATENREEKVQIVDTFGEWIAFFFGRRPEVYSYSGTLLNTKNHDWRNEFQENYEHFLRGSKAVEHRATMFLQYDDVVVEGFMLNCQTSQASAIDKSVPFSFNLLVIDRSPLNPMNLLAMRLARSTLTAAEEQLFVTMQDALSLTDDAGKPSAQKQEDLETFLLMRQYFAGNFIPGAGVATHFGGSGQLVGQNATLATQIAGTGSAKTGHSAFNGRALGSFSNSTQLSQVLGRKVSPSEPVVPNRRILPVF